MIRNPTYIKIDLNAAKQSGYLCGEVLSRHIPEALLRHNWVEEFSDPSEQVDEEREVALSVITDKVKELLSFVMLQDTKQIKKKELKAIFQQSLKCIESALEATKDDEYSHDEDFSNWPEEL